MSERQTKRRRKMLNRSWYWLNETGAISPEFWNRIGDYTSTVSPLPYTASEVSDNLTEALEAVRSAIEDSLALSMRDLMTYGSAFVYVPGRSVFDAFDPTMQVAPRRPLEELVQSVLDYEGLDDEDEALSPAPTGDK